MTVIATIVYFLILISILIIIHEFGHFLAARLTGMRADVFSVGMGNRLFGWNKITGFTFGRLPKDWDGEGHTDYRVSLFPIGGYLKIAGMVDESFDTEYAGKPAKPWEFRSKNTFQKTLAITGGVLMNTIFAFIIFSSLAYFNGKEFAATTEIAYVRDTSFASKIGFQEGDKILSINDNKIQYWDEVLDKMAFDEFGGSKVITVLRGGKKVNLNVEGELIVRALADKSDQKDLLLGMRPAGFKMMFGSPLTGEPADKIGLKKGDTAVAVNGEIINTQYEFIDILQKNKNEPVLLTWKRGDKIMESSVKPNREGKIGIMVYEGYFGETKKVEYGMLASTAMGFTKTIDVFKLLVNTIAEMVKGTLSPKESVGGPIMIAKGAFQQAQQGFSYFMRFMAFLSVTLAFMNILPFPALDGGHLVFIIIEGLMRKEVPVKIKLGFQQIGTVLLLILMALIVYNDIVR